MRISYPRWKPEDVIRTIQERLPALLDVDLLLVYSGEKRPDDYVLVKRVLGIPRLEPHIYTEAEYQEVESAIRRWIQEGIVLWSRE
ncbi:MAG: hypothetical protein H5U36_08205 [Candidatus Caldatribacterium sp.]|nr:hypothetical protein [Candidatus Caldatribacterium sp.]